MASDVFLGGFIVLRRQEQREKNKRAFTDLNLKLVLRSGGSERVIVVFAEVLA
jgi:hypothetical protein